MCSVELWMNLGSYENTQEARERTLALPSSSFVILHPFITRASLLMQKPCLNWNSFCLEPISLVMSHRRIVQALTFGLYICCINITRNTTVGCNWLWTHMVGLKVGLLLHDCSSQFLGLSDSYRYCYSWKNHPQSLWLMKLIKNKHFYENSASWVTKTKLKRNHHHHHKHLFYAIPKSSVSTKNNY